MQQNQSPQEDQYRISLDDSFDYYLSLNGWSQPSLNSSGEQLLHQEIQAIRENIIAATDLDLITQSFAESNEEISAEDKLLIFDLLGTLNLTDRASKEEKILGFKEIWIRNPEMARKSFQEYLTKHYIYKTKTRAIQLLHPEATSFLQAISLKYPEASPEFHYHMATYIDQYIDSQFNLGNQTSISDTDLEAYFRIAKVLAQNSTASEPEPTQSPTQIPESPSSVSPHTQAQARKALQAVAKRYYPELFETPEKIQSLEENFIKLITEYHLSTKDWPSKDQISLIIVGLITAFKANPTYWRPEFHEHLHKKAKNDINRSPALLSLTRIWPRIITPKRLVTDISPIVLQELSNHPEFTRYTKLRTRTQNLLQSLNINAPTPEEIITPLITDKWPDLHTLEMHSPDSLISFLENLPSEIAEAATARIKNLTEFLLHTITEYEERNLEQARPPEPYRPPNRMASFQKLTGDTRNFNQYPQTPGPRMADFNIVSNTEPPKEKKSFFRRIFSRKKN